MRRVSHDCRRLLVKRFCCSHVHRSCEALPLDLFCGVPSHSQDVIVFVASTTPRRCPLPRRELGWRGLKVSGTVSLDVPCLRICSTPMPLSSSSDFPHCYARRLPLASLAFPMACFLFLASYFFLLLTTSYFLLLLTSFFLLLTSWFLLLTSSYFFLPLTSSYFFLLLLTSCHLSLVTCHLSLVTCHLSLVTSYFLLLTFDSQFGYGASAFVEFV